MNRIRKYNAAKGVQDHYNEYKEFDDCEIEAHICSSFLQLSGMKSLSGNAV